MASGEPIVIKYRDVISDYNQNRRHQTLVVMLGHVRLD